MKEQATKVELVEMMEVGTTCLGVPPNSDPKNLTGTLEESRQKNEYLKLELSGAGTTPDSSGACASCAQFMS
jgi:hypothetical protein